MTSEKNPISSNNLILRIISAFLALGILFFVLLYFGLNGALVLVFLISAVISIELANLFFSNDLYFKCLAPVLTSLSLWLSLQNLKPEFNILPMLIGLISLPWIYRNKTALETFDRLTVYLLIVFYCYLLPLQIFEIFKLDEHFLYFIFFGLLAFGTDTLAYISGKFFGRKFFKIPFQPNISSSKTIEGFIGAMLWPVLLVFLAKGLGVITMNLFGFILLYLTAVAAVSGDLIASLIKRKSLKKDSGHFFIGHGGFLDRLDSLLLSAPFYLIATRHFTLLWS